MIGYYTRDQLLKVIHAWRVEAEPPRKGQKLIVAFPNTEQYDWAKATITVHTQKSTYGKPLFKVVLSNPRAHTVVNSMIDEIPPKGFMGAGFGDASFPIAGGGQG